MMIEGMEIFKGNRQLFTLKALNFFSSRLFSFIVPVGGEEFINPFLRFLNSLGKSAKMF
jgi:hypothetical protein